MTAIYENRKQEIKALKRTIEKYIKLVDEMLQTLDMGKTLMDGYSRLTKAQEQIIWRAVYELNKTDPGWQVMTHEQILDRLCEMEGIDCEALANLETPKA